MSNLVGMRGVAPVARLRGSPTRQSAAPTSLDELAGIRQLWDQTLGDPNICVAVLDGPVELAHPSLRTANLTQIGDVAGAMPDRGAAGLHATSIASLIFGQAGGPVRGLAPRCRGLSVPIFSTNPGSGLRPCSQLDLARAISLALVGGANVINISAGEFSPSARGSYHLERVVRQCAQRDVLIVAAAGNDGCECPHIPAALESVLAVGAMNSRGEPLAWSNWGNRYESQGILAPGEAILGALAGGGTVRASGTSIATAIVSGVVALLLSLERKHGIKPSPNRAREALLRSALGCGFSPVPDCRRLLAGRINVLGAIRLLSYQRKLTMSDAPSTQSFSPAPGSFPSPTLAVEQPIQQGLSQPAQLEPSACGCKSCGGAAPSRQLVYVLGQLGYDLVSEARLDSLTQAMAANANRPISDRSIVFDAAEMLKYLKDNPWDAASLEWTLSLDGSPVYAIRPNGPFATEAYEELRDFLEQQLLEGVERVSIPGVISGKATLLNGQVVPVIEPVLRGMCSWTTSALVKAAVGQTPNADAAQDEKDAHARKQAGLRDFLDRVYHEHRNLGILPEERALNFAATNAYQAEKVYETAIKGDMDLESINVTRSPICRPGSDCWDVELYFFYPERQVQTVRKVFRFTVDVSDAVPVTVGPTRSWHTR